MGRSRNRWRLDCPDRRQAETPRKDARCLMRWETHYASSRIMSARSGLALRAKLGNRAFFELDVKNVLGRLRTPVATNVEASRGTAAAAARVTDPVAFLDRERAVGVLVGYVRDMAPGRARVDHRDAANPRRVRVDAGELVTPCGQASGQPWLEAASAIHAVRAARAIPRLELIVGGAF